MHSNIMITVGALRHLLNVDGDRVRHLVLGQVQQLFPDQLGNDQSLGLIGHHVVGIILRSLGKKFFDLIEQSLNVGTVGGADRDDRREIPPRGVFGDDRQYLFALDQIEFVDDEHDGAIGRLQTLEDIFLAAAEFLIGVDDEQDHIDLLESALRRLEHVLAQLKFGLMNARGVEENDLRVVDGQDALNARTSSLRLI